MALSVFAFIDLLATLAFLVAAGIGVKNYQDTDLEQTFWATFVLVSIAGFTWMSLVTAEWAGISGALMDALSTSLESIVIGVYSIGSIGTFAVVQDLKESQAKTVKQSREA